MPEPQNVRYTIHAGGQTTVWGPKTFEANKDKLFTDFPDATVVQMNQDWQDGEPDDMSSYVIKSDGGNTVWGPKTFAANKDNLLRDFPNAEIYRARRVNYWGEKLGEIENRITELKKQRGDIPEESAGVDPRNMTADDFNAEVQRQSSRRAIKNELDQLYRMREQNPAWQKYWEVSNTEIDEGTARIDSKQEELYRNNPDAYEAYKKANMLGGRIGPMAGFSAASALKTDAEFNKEKESYDAARLMLRDAKKTATAPSRYAEDDKNAGQDFWRGIVDGAPEAWSVAGLMRAGLNMHLIEAIRDIQDNEGKNVDIRELVNQDRFNDLGYLNGGEKELVKAFVKRAEIESMKSDTISRSYQAGQSAIASAGFMLDFLTMGGFGDAAANAATKALGVSVEAAGRNAFKVLGAEALAGTIKALAMTPLMPSSYANFVNGLLQMDDAGTVDLSGKKMLQQAGDILIENISETIGSKPLDLIGIPLEKIKFPDWAKALHNTSVISGLRKAGYNGFFEEMFEEWTGNALRVITGVDKDALKDFANWDQQFITAGAFAPMSLAGLPMSMYQHRAASKRMGEKGNALETIIHKLEGMKDFKLDVSDLDNPEDLGRYMGDVFQQMVRNGAKPADAFKAVMEYTAAVGRYKYTTGAMEDAKDEERSARLASMDAAMGTASWHRLGKNDASFVRTITDADGNTRFVTAVDKDGGMMLVDRQGMVSFLSKDALASGIANETLTDSGEQFLNDYLDREAETERRALDQQRQEQYSKKAIADLAQRALPGMQIALGSEENREMGTILDFKGGRFYVGKQDGTTTILTTEDVASRLGIKLNTESEEQREEREAEQETRFQDNRALAMQYKGQPFAMDGKQYILVGVTRGENGAYAVHVKDEAGQDSVINMSEGEFGTILNNWVSSPLSGVAPGTALNVEFEDGSSAQYQYVRTETQDGEVVVIGRGADGEEVELAPEMISNYADLTGGAEASNTGVPAAPVATTTKTDFFDDPIANALGIGEEFVYVTNDGRRVVNSTELWNKNPELWAQWNDQNPARITSTLDYLDSKVKTLDKQVSSKQKELDTANKNGADQGTLEQLSQELNDITARQRRVRSLYDSYAAAEQRRQEEARRTAEEEAIVKKIFPNLNITDPALRHEIALAAPALERVQKLEGLSVIEELGEALSREAEGESLTPTEATMRMFSEAAKTPGLLASMMEQYAEVAESVDADTVAEKQDILGTILAENQISIENGTIGTDQSGVSADASVRADASGEGEVGPAADTAGSGGAAPVQGARNPAAVRQAIIDNAQQRLDDWNARMQAAATDDERQALLQEKVGILQEMADGLGIPITVTTDGQLDAQYLADGAPQSTVDYVRQGIVDARQNGERPRAFYDPDVDRSYMLADYITTAMDGVTAAVHENKHLENTRTGAVKESLKTGVTTLEMANAVYNLTRSHAYDNAGREKLADEVFANAAELAELYGVEALPQKLREAGITNEKFINFVQKNIRDGRSQSSGRTQGSERNPLQYRNGRGSGQQNGRDSRRGSAEVGGRNGAEEGGAPASGVGEAAESGLDTPDENGVTPAQTREITAAVGGEMEDGPATRFSVTAIAEGAGLEAFGSDEEGNVVFVGPDGTRFTGKDTITADYLKNLPNTVMGYMMADAKQLGTITDAQADNIWQKYADMLNAFLQKGLAENGGIETLSGQWQWVAETAYKTVASNSDDQYSYSLDITRVCKKNEAVIKTIAEMQRRLGYGVTPGQIMDIYLASEREGYQVPCPVCYVFSRYIRNGQYATIMLNGQRKYGKRLKDPRTLTDAEKKKEIRYWRQQLEKQRKNNEKHDAVITKAKEDIQTILDKVDKLGLRLLSGNLDKAEERRIKQEISALDARYRKALNVVSQAGLDGWITNFAVHETKNGWELYEDSFQGFPEEMALDLRETATVLREYPAIQRYRNSRGAAAGKEITFEANNDIGEVPMMLGVPKTKLKTAPNYYKLAVQAKDEKTRNKMLKEARKRLEKAHTYAQQQSLRGGQRMWSWSDNIERLSPDVFVNLLQMEILGGALQSYSKQLEGINLVARMGGYVNGSLMGKGIGYREVEESEIERVGDQLFMKDGDLVLSDGTVIKAPVYESEGKYYTLEFDDVVGIDAYGKEVDGKHYKGLFELNHTLDKAGNILVGMDDIHVRAAMADGRVFFIIPWHASGGSVHLLRQMLSYLGVDLKAFNPKDYTNVQEEKRSEDVSEFLAAFWEAHKNETDFRVGIAGGIPSGQDGKLSPQQVHYKELRDAILKGEDLSGEWLAEIEGDEFLSQLRRKVAEAVDIGEMTAGDTKFIYPYEYWDETSTYDTADVNGARYLEYCRRLGYKPKFVGKLDGSTEDFGNFADDKGYWKLLIDRRMYDTQGNFQDLTPVSSEGFSPDLVDPEKTAQEFQVTRVADDNAAKKVADRVIEREESRPGGVANVNYNTTLDKAVAEYEKELAKTPEDYTPAQRAVIDRFLGGLEEDFGSGPIWSFVGEKGAAELDKASNATVRMHNRDIAIAMEEIDADPLAIKMATGWERGADGAWRYETSDVIAPSEKINALKTGDSIRLGDLVNPGSGPLTAYPELADFTVKVVPKKESFYGQLMFKDKQIDLNLGLMSEDYFGDVAVKANSTLAHEVQHAIQHIEGFAYGSNSGLAMDNPVLAKLKDGNPALFKMIKIFGKTPTRILNAVGREGLMRVSRGENAARTGFNNLSEEDKEIANQLADELENMTDEEFSKITAKIKPTLVKARNEAKSRYQRSAGEVEARNVQRRQAMTPEQREATLAETTEDVPRSEQIINRAGKSQQDIRFSVSNERNDIFISNAEKAAQEIKMEKATPEQWLKMLEKSGGLKAGEDKWIGLSDWLKEQKGTVTKQQVLDYIDEHKIQIEEVNYAEESEDAYDKALDSYREEFQNFVEEGKAMGFTTDAMYDFDEDEEEEEDENRETRNAYDYAYYKMVDIYGDDFEMAFEREGDSLAPRLEPWEEDYSDAAKYFLRQRMGAEAANPINSTRMQYTTEGLGDYREIALTVPTIEPWNEEDRIHFGDAGEGRAIAWIRFGDAVVGLNKKALVIDEIQSKRHQEAREQGGYKDDAALKKAIARRDAAKEEYDKYHNALLDKYGNYNTMRVNITPEENAESQRLYHVYSEAQNAVELNGFDPMEDEEYRRMREEMEALNNNEEFARLRKEWTEITERTRIFNRIEDIRVYVDEDGKRDFDVFNGTSTIRIIIDDNREITSCRVKSFVGKNLNDVFGREVADRLMSADNGTMFTKYSFPSVQKDLERRDEIDQALAPYQQRVADLSDMMYRRKTELAEAFNRAHRSRVPAAPFEKNWHELAFKRMLRYAAENGYDYVTWTTGDQQAERYDIGKAVNSIFAGIDRNGERHLMIYPNGGGAITVTHDENGKILDTRGDDGVLAGATNISDIVGKEIAAQALTVNEPGTANGKEFKGDGLHIGGEGMRGFYDDILPRFVNKYGKKWGVKVENIQLYDLGEGPLTMHSIPVTAEMKESVMQGQPMFSIHGREVRYPDSVTQEQRDEIEKNITAYSDENSEGYKKAKAIVEEIDAMIKSDGDDKSDAIRREIEELKKTASANNSLLGKLVKDPSKREEFLSLKKQNAELNATIREKESSVKKIDLTSGDNKSRRDKAILEAGILDNENWRGIGSIPAEYQAVADFFKELGWNGDSMMYATEFSFISHWVAHHGGLTDVEVSYDTLQNLYAPDIVGVEEGYPESLQFIRRTGANEWSRTSVMINRFKGDGSLMFGTTYKQNKNPRKRLARILDLGYPKGAAASDRLSSDFDNLDAKVGINSESARDFAENLQETGGATFSVVADPAKIDELEAGKKVKVYRSMQVIDGKLYPPMSAMINGELRDPIELGVWEQADEHPELADENGDFLLEKGDGSEPMKVAYAPYIHTRRSPLNEQFSSAYKRPNLVIVESEIPESELTSGYTADRSKKSTGEHDWPSGKVSNALANQGDDTRKVILSRWAKPLRIVPNSEVADIIAKKIEGKGLSFPYNVVTPGLREELRKRGVQFEGWQGNKPKDVDEIIAGMQQESSSDNGILFSVAYHGSPADFTEFEEGHYREGVGSFHRPGFYFASDEKSARPYAYDRGNGAFMYEVELPDDDGTNYIHVFTSIPKPRRRELAQRIQQLFPEKEIDVEKKIVNKPILGEDLMGMFTNDELDQLGYVGVVGPMFIATMPQLQYIMFNPKDIRVISKTDVSNGNETRFSTVSDEQTEKLFAAAKERFGTTRDIREAGYVLPDGTMLDFSGRHWSSGDTSWMNGLRQVDHRDISELEFEDDGNTPSGLETDMSDFIRRGAIRIDSSGSINLATKPTAAQESVLRRLMQSGKGYVWVDFGDGSTSDHSVSYEGINPERVINDIRRYFNEGVKPESRAMFSVVSAEQDREYLSAVESGDMEKAQRMVAEAAKRAMPDTKAVDKDGNPLVLFHGTPTYGFTEFAQPGESLQGPIWVTDDKRYAEIYADQEIDDPNKGIYRLFADVKNPVDLGYIEDVIGSDAWNSIAEKFGMTPEELHRALEDGPSSYERAVRQMNYIYDYTRGDKFVGLLRTHGYDGAFALEEGINRIPTIAVIDPSQVKSAEPITRDEAGNVIPLSQRFNRENNDIRFSVANRNEEAFFSNAARAVEDIQMTKATPEQWLKMIEKGGGLKAGEDKWIGLSDWLKASDKKTITKEEVADFIRENQIRIEEVHYTDAEDIPMGGDKEWNDIVAKRYGKEVHEAIEFYPGDGGTSTSIRDEEKLVKLYKKYAKDYDYDYVLNEVEEEPFSRLDMYWMKQLAERMADYGDGEIRKKYGKTINPVRIDYTTYGLEKKREIALTVPTIESWGEHDETHFGDAGKGRAIAWVRFGDAYTGKNPGYMKGQIEYVGPKLDVPGIGSAIHGILMNWNDQPEVMRNIRPDEQFMAARGMFENAIRDNMSSYNDEQKAKAEQVLAALPELKEEYFKRSEPNGGKVLFIDEIQSKRHQEGREKGYKRELTEEEIDRLEEARAVSNHMHRMGAEIARLMNNALKPYDADMLAGKITFEEVKEKDEDVRNLAELRVKNVTDTENADKALDEIRKGFKLGSIPAAPFEKNWHELALKRMLRLAAEEGYEYVAWTPGAQQVERYGLAELITSIRINPIKNSEDRIVTLYIARSDGDYHSLVVDKEGNITKGNFVGQNIGEVVGKELAAKIMAAEETTEIKGDGLRVGGEGMKGFYDDILPRFMNKYGKKWGVKVEDKHIPDIGMGDGFVAHMVKVTPEMKESVLSGQPMFSIRQSEQRRRDEIARVEKDGLGAVIGQQNVDPLMRSVYRAVPKDILGPVVDKAIADGLNIRGAMNDYLHGLAAEGPENDETGLLRALFDEVRAMSGDPDLTDADIRYMIWKSTGESGDDILSFASDVAMKRRWGVGESDPRFSTVSDFKANAGLARTETDEAIKAAEEERREARRQARRTYDEDIRALTKAMAGQREYDKKTVSEVVRLAKTVMNEGGVTELTRREVSRLLTLINGANGKSPAFAARYADDLFDYLLEHIVKEEMERFMVHVNIKDSTIKQPGVEKVGKLDPIGQITVKAFRTNMRSKPEEISRRLEELAEKISSSDKAVSEQAEAEYQGLVLARDYAEQIGEKQEEELDLLDEMDDEKTAYRNGDLTRKEHEQYVKTAREALRQSRMERIDLYREFTMRLTEIFRGSASKAKAFREAEKQRIEDIHHDANRDMQGVPTDEHRSDKRLQRLLNSSIIRFFAKPLATFDQMLRVIGRKSVTGEGFLWNRLVRQWESATEEQQRGMYEATQELDAKVSEVFGKKMIWSDLYGIERKLPGMDVTFYDGGEKKSHTLTQGNLLYIYMVDKMVDGRMKLRKMGITEEHVAAIKEHLDPRFIELADWLQDEYLVNKRNKYNEVHERMFGAPMAAIENYFPLKILSNARVEEVDLGSMPEGQLLPSTTTGSILKRRKNSLALDLMHTDAFSLVIEHIEQMEDWAAYAEFRRDINTLLSYKRFRNQVMNMNTIYGSGKALWENFMNVCKIATGTYRPKVSRYDADALYLNAAKGVTAAKIAFRVNTAIKQLLSFPAYFPDANPVYLAKSLATAPASWNWCMENLPVFQKRWRSRIAGDTRLMDTDSDWKIWKNNVVKLAARWGMTPNALVDATTVAIGAKAMYDTRYDRYIADGYTAEEADKRAKQDATILYNQTQQSSENAFVSAIQLDRTFLSVLLSTYRNSSMSYQRQLHDAVRTVGRMLTPGYREESIEFMTRQRQADGLDEEDARDGAQSEYNRQTFRSMARIAVFGYGLQLLWKLGSNMWYLLFGDDDDKKEQLLEDALVAELAGPIEGLAGGNVISDAWSTFSSGGSMRNVGLGELPIESDIENIIQMMEYDKPAAVGEIINLIAQSGVGVNPQTITDVVVAILDAFNGDLGTAKEFAILMMRIGQVPQSTIDEFLVDEVSATAAEAQKMSVEELAQRYAKYKMSKGAPLTGGMYDEALRAKREKSYNTKFKNKVKERNKLHEEKNKAE